MAKAERVLTGHKRYQAMLLDWAQAVLNPIYEKKVRIEDVPHEKRVLFEDIFYRYTELIAVYENLELCEEFIKAAPPRRKNVGLDKYLAYHISFYLYEVYTLKERLVSYARVIDRLQKKREPLRHRQQSIPAIIQLVEETLEGLVKTRGRHVHSRAFEDEDVRRLSTMALLSRHSEKFSDHAKDEYFWSKTKWQKTLAGNRKGIASLLDVYFDTLHTALDPKRSNILEAAKSTP